MTQSMSLQRFAGGDAGGGGPAGVGGGGAASTSTRAGGAYWLHRRYPSFVDEVTVEVDDAGATARVGGRF